MEIPILIVCRDRLSPLLGLLDYLERAGCEQIYLVDNASSYPPLLEFFAETPHEVVRLGENFGHLAPWRTDLLSRLDIESRFVYSDPDIVPIEECPLDALEYFGEVLDRYPRYVKAGFALRIDDLPSHYPMRDQVLELEARYWERPIAPRLYEAAIDTTFALYRGPQPFSLEPAVRTGYPYLARHTSWYLDNESLPDDERYYRDRSSADPYWSRDSAPIKLARMIAARSRAGLGAAASLPEVDDEPASAPTDGLRVGFKEAQDPKIVLTSGAWKSEPALVDETEYTPWAEPGWHSWNDMSPELEFCQFAADLVSFIKPHTVIETGTGQGFLTRRVAARLQDGQRLLCFEADPTWRSVLASVPLFAAGSRCVLARSDSPTELQLVEGGISILDSGVLRRCEELRTWWRAASPGAIVLVHDVSTMHPPGSPHVKLAELILELEIPGTFLKNPRGSFLGLKPGGPSP